MTEQASRCRAAVTLGSLLLALLGAAPGPAPRRAFLELPLPEPVRFARVVVQQEFRPATYQGTDPSGRYAFVEGAIIDLASERVAWRHDYRLLPVQTVRHRIMVASLSHVLQPEVALWDLNDGSTTIFPGTVVEHIGMAERVAVQRDSRLDIIDTRRGRRLEVLDVQGEVLSTVPSGAAWWVLERVVEEGKPARLQLASTHLGPQERMTRISLELPAAEVSLVPLTFDDGDPFLALDENGALSLEKLEVRHHGTPGVEDEHVLWTSRLEEHTGIGQPWSTERIDLQRPPVVLPFFRPGQPVVPSPAIERRLARVPTATDLGVFVDRSPDARHAVTAGADRTCYWSIERAERSWCDKRYYEGMSFLDSTRLWRLAASEVATELGVLDVVSRNVFTRTFPAGSSVLPATDGRFLVATVPLDAEGYDVALWTLGGERPLWTFRGRTRGFFASNGAQVTFSHSIDNVGLVLDASTGRVVSPDGPLPPTDDPRRRPCLGADAELLFAFGATRLWLRGALVATVMDLSASQWAIVLPDGRFTGSPGAPSLLAFYSSTGTLLSRDRVEKLRDPRAVRKVFAAIPGNVEQCVAAGSRSPVSEASPAP